MTNSGEEARRPERAERGARRARLTETYGKPEHIGESDALALAMAAGALPIFPAVDPDDVVAHIYRDEAAADGWLDSNRLNHGHPTLAKVPLGDGRVIGILDLRPAVKRAQEEQ